MIEDEEAVQPIPTDSQEYFIPEFGLVNLRHLEAGKPYRGKMYRLSKDTSKQISEVVGFAASFDMPGIRTAVVDLFKVEGKINFEIERNLKPTEVVVRFMRERWNVIDTGKDEGPRPWVKTTYQARFIPEKVLIQVAEQLRIPSDKASQFIMRINFKDRTCGLITEDTTDDQFPIGSYATFTLTADVIEKAKQASGIDKFKGKKQQGVDENISKPDSNAPNMMTANNHPESDESNTATSASSGAPANDDYMAPSATSDLATESQPRLLPSVSRTASPFARAQAGAVVAAGNIASVTAPSYSLRTMTYHQDQNSEQDSNKSKSESWIAPRPSNDYKSDPPPGRERKPEPPPAPPPKPEPPPPKPQQDDRPFNPYVTPAKDRSKSGNHERSTDHHASEPQPKYATYSKSEVDQMLKQLTENINTALGSKISSQQRTFQEAIDKQEKTFSRTADSFVSTLEQSRQKLDASVAKAQEANRSELDAFKKDLSKELEQYRTQINKTVIPVVKLLEDKPAEKLKNLKEKERDLDKVSQNDATPPAKSGGPSLQTLMISNIAMAIGVLVIILMVVIPQTSALEQMKKQLDEMTAKLNAEKATNSHSPTTSGTTTANGASSKK